jgi:pyruvate dehydrogenase E2 component (dihydrolipoyllysine-residue acetyltransferase)
MKREVKLPALGEEVDEGDVLKVLVSEGDRVEEGDSILEIETDKATLEVPSDASGTISKIEVSAGDRIRVGQTLLVVESEESANRTKPSPKSESEPRAAEREKPTESAEPEQNSETSEEPEPEPEAEHEPGEEEESEEERVPARARTSAARERAPEHRPEHRGAAIPAAPSVRRLARELGVDLAQVEGSGPRGRLTAEDVKELARSIVAGARGALVSPSLPDFGRFGKTKAERMSALRRAAARTLSRAWTQIPHVTQHDRADITDTETIRAKYAGRVEEMGGKLTVTALAIHVAAAAVRKFPAFNASLDVAHERIVYKDYCHIGVAVDTDRGLVVPVLRNADRMSLLEIAVSLTALADKARNGKLGREDMEGSSFTVTNLGGIGGTGFTPIVNWPEVAVLGISRSRTEPFYVNGGLEPRLFLPLSLSYDHRLIDGADAARFLRFVAEALEHPLLLSLEVRR